MASPKPQDLKALHRLIKQADLALATIPAPHPSMAAARESLSAALALSRHLAQREPDAVALGAKGGAETAKRGSEYFAKIASMRKIKGGGRPKKEHG